MFSRTLTEAGWNTRVIGGNLAQEVTALKQRPGKDLLRGGGARLAAELTELGLIDDTQTFDGQTVLLRYRPVTEQSSPSSIRPSVPT